MLVILPVENSPCDAGRQTAIAFLVGPVAMRVGGYVKRVYTAPDTRHPPCAFRAGP
jgi:hypothetical protein